MEKRIWDPGRGEERMRSDKEGGYPRGEVEIREGRRGEVIQRSEEEGIR